MCREAKANQSARLPAPCVLFLLSRVGVRLMHMWLEREHNNMDGGNQF